MESGHHRPPETKLPEVERVEVVAPSDDALSPRAPLEAERKHLTRRAEAQLAAAAERRERRVVERRAERALGGGELAEETQRPMGLVGEAKADDELRVHIIRRQELARVRSARGGERRKQLVEEIGSLVLAASGQGGGERGHVGGDAVARGHVEDEIDGRLDVSQPTHRLDRAIEDKGRVGGSGG